MTSIHEGATIWARQTLESEVFSNKPDKWFKIWFYLINKANYKDNQKFKRGQAFIKYEWIEESTKATKHQIDHFMRWAKEASMLATQKATRGMVVTILNYDRFQTLDNYKSDTESELKAKQKRNKSDTILKKDKNEKNPIYVQNFALFWKNYPRKEAKKVAWESWVKVGEPESIIEKMRVILPIQMESDQWTKNNGEFIPLPATYINQERWEDEIHG